MSDRRRQQRSPSPMRWSNTSTSS